MERATRQERRDRLLVADDEPPVLQMLGLTLDRRGYEVMAARDGREALRLFQERSPALMVLDINLGDISGFEVCRRVRESSTIPIMVISGRDATEDKLWAFRLGADDYITKPFDLRELLARIQAVLRRASLPSRDARKTFRWADLEIDFSARRVTRGHEEISCTPIEFELLRVLVANAGKVIPHETLLREVWGPEYGTEREYLRVHLSHLRQKLEPEAPSPRFIQTIPRVGYRFQPPGVP